MNFNINKYHILQVGTENQKHEYEMAGVKPESVEKCFRELRIMNVPKP